MNTAVQELDINSIPSSEGQGQPGDASAGPSEATPSALSVGGFRQTWKGDLISGFQVFLIALPLCLGIAQASSVPPLSGIIAAVVGGALVSLLSGSYVTINGPAAGLIVVIFAAVESLGAGDPAQGYRQTLAAIVVAGLIQVFLGLTKAGKLSSFFPSSAVHGLLASIGIIIIAKQSYVMLGEKPVGETALAQLWNLPQNLVGTNPDILVIGVSTLAVVILLPYIPRLKVLPAPLIGVLVGMALGAYFDLEHEHLYVPFLYHHEYKLGPNFLVSLPADVRQGIVHPDFSRFGEAIFWKAVLMISVIASLETLLSAKAVDKLDPYERKSDLNRDLTAIGAGTVISGMLGGLPMIAEIVRSSANINAGAKSRWSNFFHGVFMAAFVVLAPGLIHRIPLASLAAILCYTGFRLASPKEFKKTYQLGSDQFLIFVATIVITLATDLLIGILAGIVIKLSIHLRRGLKACEVLHCDCQVDIHQKEATLHFKGAVVFTNLLDLRAHLDEVPNGLDVKLDFAGAHLVDHSALEYLEQYHVDYQRTGGQVKFVGLEGFHAQSRHPLAARSR